MAKVNLIANDDGMISIDEVPYQKGTLQPRPFPGYTHMLIEDRKGENLVPSTRYQDYQNNGVDFASANALKTFVEANFFFDGGGGGGGSIVYEELDGTELDGFQYVEPTTGNLELTVATGASGILRIKNAASHTLEIFEVNVPINDSATNDGLTAIAYNTITDLGVIGLEDKDGNYMEIPIPVPDTTAPAPTSATIEDADPADVVIVFDEALDAGNVPDAGDFTSLLGKTFTPAIVGGNLVLTADSDYVNGEVEQITYTPGTTKLQDAEGNEVDAFDTDDFGGVVNNVAAVGGYDADAQTYFDAVTIAGGTLSTLEMDSYNAWVVEEKAQGRYAKMISAYPILGGTAAAHAINSINPGTYDLVFNGVWTHTANGMNHSATNTDYADTGINPVSVLGQDDAHMSLYVNNDTAVGAYDMGSITARSISIAWIGGNVYTNCNSSTDETTAATDFLGAHVVTRTSAGDYHYVRGATVNTKSVASNGVSAAFIVIGNLGGLNNIGSTRRYAFATVGAGLTSAEAQGLNANTLTLQTAIGRN